jgi:hypothetical protein
MRAITLDQLDELNIHLMGAKAMLKVIEITMMEGALDDLSNTVLGESLHGIGLLLNAAGDAVKGGQS